MKTVFCKISWTVEDGKKWQNQDLKSGHLVPNPLFSPVDHVASHYYQLASHRGLNTKGLVEKDNTMKKTSW